MRTDCVVVGAGPAGLATSAALTQRGVDHVILERRQVGDTWRTQRWDSFRLNTPGWMNQLLSDQGRYAYADRAMVVQKLEQLAVNSPIHTGVRVARLAPAGNGYALRTSDGVTRWTSSAMLGGNDSSPSLDAGSVYVAYGGGQVYSIARDTGQFRWHYQGCCSGGGGSTPVLPPPPLQQPAKCQRNAPVSRAIEYTWPPP